MVTEEILETLVAFPSISGRPNRDVVEFVTAYLADRGVPAEAFWADQGRKASVFATLGPAGGPGVVLSGHMDVVPVEGQRWTSDPFRLREQDGRLYGRGTADMKGFLACALSLVDRIGATPLATPLHLCFSYDEEIGCVGVRPMLDELAARGFRPRFCIIGEPTEMRVAIGHKGKVAARAVCRGASAHSAFAPNALNAIHLAADFVQVLRRRQRGLERRGARDAAYDIPYSTLHAGLIGGGAALNIVPDLCTVDFEIRTVGAEDGQALLDGVARDAARLARAQRARFAAADISIDILNAYPGLDTPASAEVVSYVASLAGNAAASKVAFGTEGGLFAAALEVGTVICGPGSMAQGHKPDEFIDRGQLRLCDAMLDRLLARIAA